MDNLNDITDDLLCLPGYVRRNLLLIRDLDLKSTSLFNEANKLSQLIFNNPSNTSTGNTSGNTNTSGNNSTPNNINHTKDYHNKDKDNLFVSYKKQFDEIQNLRMKGIYILQEKIDVNSQITSMLKYEYENLKTKFDALYTEMELKSQIPHDLKVYISSNNNNNNKKKYLGQTPEGVQGSSTTGTGSETSNQLDIKTMFNNILNNNKSANIAGDQDNEKEKGPVSTEGSEAQKVNGTNLNNSQFPEYKGSTTSKIVNRQINN